MGRGGGSVAAPGHPEAERDFFAFRLRSGFLGVPVGVLFDLGLMALVY